MPRLSSLPLPELRFVPGTGPRPARSTVDIGARDAQQMWLYGIDLFNARYYWEAHEAWETLWRAARPRSPESDTLKGLIQIAASLLKLEVGNELAARRLAARGVALLRTAAQGAPVFRSLELEPLAREAERCLIAPEAPLSRDVRFTLAMTLNSE